MSQEEKEVRSSPLPWMEDCQVLLPKSIGEVKSWIERGYDRYDAVCHDLETTSVDAFTCDIVGLSFAWNDNDAIYIPTGHEVDSHLNLDLKEVLDVVRPMLEQKIVKIFNWNFEGQVLPRHNINVSRYFDLMPICWLKDMDANEYNLKYSARTYLGLETISIGEVKGAMQEPLKGRKNGEILFARTSPLDAVWYGAQDALLTSRLDTKVRPEVEKQQHAMIIQVENEVMEVVNKMARNGIHVDRGFLAQSLKDCEVWKDLCHKRLVAAIGDIDVDSPRQLADALVSIGVPLPRTKPTSKFPEGQHTTADAAIQEMFKSKPETTKWQPLFEDIALLRSLTKDAGTYINRLLEFTTDENNKIRMKHNSCGAPTGRMSAGGTSEGDGYAQLNSMAIPATSEMDEFVGFQISNPGGLKGPGPASKIPLPVIK